MTTIKEILAEVLVPLLVAFALQSEVDTAIAEEDEQPMTAEEYQEFVLEEQRLQEEREQAEESVINFGTALVDAAKDVREVFVTNALASEERAEKVEKEENKQSFFERLLQGIKEFFGTEDKEDSETTKELKNKNNEDTPNIALAQYRPFVKVEDREKVTVLKPFGTYEPVVLKDDTEKREQNIGKGMSFKTDIGAAIYSPIQGKVIQVSQRYEDLMKLDKDDSMVSPTDRLTKAYGNFVRVQAENGTIFTFGYLTNTFHEVGDTVKAGEVIGIAGETGVKAQEELADEEYKYGVFIRIKTEEGHDLNPMLLMDLPVPFEKELEEVSKKDTQKM